MAVSVHCTGITTRENGSGFINFADGSQIEFTSLQDLLDRGSAIDAPDQLETARSMLVRWWTERSTDASNTSLLVGKTLTFDMGRALCVDVA